MQRAKTQLGILAIFSTGSFFIVRFFKLSGLLLSILQILHRILPLLVPRVAPMHFVVWKTMVWFIIHLIHRFSCISKHKISYSNKINSFAEGLHVPNLCRFVFCLMVAEYWICSMSRYDFISASIFQANSRCVFSLRLTTWSISRTSKTYSSFKKILRLYLYGIILKSKVIVVKLILNFLYG